MKRRLCECESICFLVQLRKKKRSESEESVSKNRVFFKNCVNKQKMYKVVKIVLIFLAGPGQFCLVGPDWSWAVLAGSKGRLKRFICGFVKKR